VVATGGKMIWVGRGLVGLLSLLLAISAAMKLNGGAEVIEGMAQSIWRVLGRLIRNGSTVMATYGNSSVRYMDPCAGLPDRPTPPTSLCNSERLR
jgi:hypothetical protein